MEDKRKGPRYFIHWRCVIVVDINGGREVIRGKTLEVSDDGFSMISPRNISPGNAATAYLLVDPGNAVHAPTVVEAHGNIVNTVLSGQQGGFRLGIQFTQFVGGGKKLLLNHLPKDVIRPGRIATTPEPPLTSTTSAAAMPTTITNARPGTDNHSVAAAPSLP